MTEPAASTSVLIKTALKRRRIFASNIILVPYARHLVPKYNSWMQNSELQFLTGSERLSLTEEYAMFESWTADTNKCTFIVLDRAAYEALSQDQLSEEEREIAAMVGDVNFYVLDASEGIAEIEIMIAESAARGRGLGRQAVLVMMHFGHQMAGVQKYEAKIKMSNEQSQKLFGDYFGFCEVSRSAVFEEITYQADLMNDCRLKDLFKTVHVQHKLLFWLSEYSFQNINYSCESSNCFWINLYIWLYSQSSTLFNSNFPYVKYPFSFGPCSWLESTAYEKWSIAYENVIFEWRQHQANLFSRTIPSYSQIAFCVFCVERACRPEGRTT